MVVTSVSTAAVRPALAAAVVSVALALPASAQGTVSARPTPPGAGGVASAPCEIAHPGTAAFSHTLSVQGLLDCNAAGAGPWTARYTPDGTELWVPLFGSGFGNENCRIARYDAQTDQLLSFTPVGLGPEELVFMPDASGGVRYAFVTNSTDSTVSVLSPAGVVLRTISIPFDPGSFFQTAFPFGLAVSPDGTEVFVGTLDGSGDVWVIDVSTMSLATQRTLHFGADHGFGRMLFAGQDLVLPTTVFHPGFQGSTAELILVDPDDPAGARTTVLASSPDATAFPSPQDVALLCESRLFVAGFDMGANVYVLHAPTGALTTVLPTGTTNPGGSFQGLGLSSRGLLGVADIASNEIAFLDGWMLQHLGVLDANLLPGFHAQLNELSFAPGGGRLVVPGLASDTLAVFDVQ